MQTKSRTRIEMERSATYLAYGHEGRNGLDPQTVEMSLGMIKNWKKYFVQYMQDKPNLQNGGKVLGKEGAALLADNIFKAYYDQEVRAMEEPTIGRFFGREPGNYEYGDYEAFHSSRADEVTKDDFGWKLYSASRTPEKRKNYNFSWMMDKMLYGPKNKVNKLYINARYMYRYGAITKEQWLRLEEAKKVRFK